MMFELESAARRLGINLMTTYFYVPVAVDDAVHEEFALQRPVWTKFFAPVGDIDVIGEQVKCHMCMLAHRGNDHGTFSAVRYSAQDVCMALLSYSNKGVPMTHLRLTILCALIIAATPLITWRISTDTSTSLWVLLFYTTSTYVTLLACTPCLVFLVVSTVDASRKYRVFKILSAMIRPTPLDTQCQLTLRERPTPDPNQRNPPTGAMVRRARSHRSSIQLAASTFIGNRIPRMVSVVPLQGERTLESGTDGNGLDMLEQGRRGQGDGRNELSPPTLVGHTFRSFLNSSIPMIHSSMVSNVEAWCACRVVMGGFGARFKHRIDLYLGKNMHWWRAVVF